MADLLAFASDSDGTDTPAKWSGGTSTKNDGTFNPSVIL
jgi:hypothetical protein